MTCDVRRATCDFGEQPDIAHCKLHTKGCARTTECHPGHTACFTSHVARRTNCGFTLIEMVVIVTILALAAAIIVPLLPSTDAARLRSSARRLATVIRYLGDRSVTTKERYRMQVDLSENTVTVKKMVNGEERTPEDPFFARSILEEGVTIEDIEVPRLGKTGEGETDVDFGAAGLGDFIVVHLKGPKGDHLTVTALPCGGKVEVLDGYQEMKL